MARLNRTPLFIALMTLFTLPPALEAHQPEMDPSWASMSCEKSRNNTTSITIFSGNDTSLSYSKITTNFSEIIETSDQMTDAVKEYQRLLDAQAALLKNGVRTQPSLLEAIIITALRTYEEKLNAAQAQLAAAQEELESTQSMLVASYEEYRSLADDYQARGFELRKAKSNISQLTSKLTTTEQSLCRSRNGAMENTSLWDYFSARLFGISSQCTGEAQLVNKGIKQRGTRTN